MSSGSRPSSRLRKSVLLGLFAAAVWFYMWAPASFPMRWVTPDAPGYYAELTDAWLDGHLHLARQPDPRLVALADPYDPAQNAPFRVNDLSYFAGRYHLYHGVTPVLVLLAPFRLLTGLHLTDPAAALVFCSVGAWFGLLLLGDIRRRAAPQASVFVLAGCALAALFGNGAYLVLRGSSVNHVAIAAAYCFLSLSVWAAFRALCTERAAWPWLVLAGAATGLAIAARPNYVFGAVALLVPVWVLARQDRAAGGGSRGWLRHLAAVWLPPAVMVLGMLWHNHARFGQALEFGQRYMLGGWDQRQLGFLGWKNAPVNLWHYLFSPGEFSADFPFLTAPNWRAIGVFCQSPFVWLAGLAPVLFLRRPSSPSAPLRPLVVMLLVLFTCNLGLLLLLPSGNDALVATSANARYTFDFLPLLVLLGGAGVLGVAHQLAGTVWPSRLLRAGLLVLTAASLLASLSLDFQRFPPETYRRLAQVLNRPGYVVRNWLGVTYGPLQLDVVFPRERVGHTEPLVATGTPEAGDLLYVNYDSPATVRFGLVGTAMRGPLSPPIPVTYGEPHRLGIRMGSLYPPVGHPGIAALDDATLGRLKRRLHIELDGRPVYEIPAHFFPSKPRQVRVGATDFLENYSAPEFTGRILAESRLPIDEPASPEAATPDYGPVRLVVRLPADRIGLNEPLIVSGVPNAGDFIYIHYANDRHIALGLDHWGHMGIRTPWLPVDYSVNHTIEVHMGALLPPPGHALWGSLPSDRIEQMRRRVRILLDREVVLDTEQATYEASPYDVLIGRNAIGGSTCGYEFTGQIKSAQRLPLPVGDR